MGLFKAWPSMLSGVRLQKGNVLMSVTRTQNQCFPDGDILYYKSVFSAILPGKIKKLSALSGLTWVGLVCHYSELLASKVQTFSGLGTARNNGCLRGSFATLLRGEFGRLVRRDVSTCQTLCSALGTSDFTLIMLNYLA